LILHNQMRPILSITHLRSVGNQVPKKGVSTTFTIWITTIVNDGGDVVHFAHADDVGGEEIETVLVAAFFAELELGARVFACDGGDGGEE